MEKLDGDDEFLISSIGEKAARDLVQFLPFNKFINNRNILKRTLIEELPD